MWKHALLCAILAPRGVVEAAVFALPAPTLATPPDNGWSPAPTTAPRLGAIELFRREQPGEVFQSAGTCGFFDGASTSAYTCRQSAYVCAINTYYGNHGCCDPYEPAESCTLATTCMPQSLLSKSCDGDCSKNDYVTKCSASANPECYEFQFIYTLGPNPTTMKEYGCTDTATTAVIPLTPDGYSAPGSGSTSTSLSSSTSSTSSPTPIETPQQATKGDGSTNNTPAIIGGVIGGLALLSALIFAIVFLVLRDRRRKRELAQSQASQQHHDWAGPPLTPGMSEVHYSPDGFIGCNVYGEDPRSAVTEDSSNDTKNWKTWGRVSREKKIPQDRITSCGGDGMYEAVETQGRQIHEAPT